MCAWQQALYRYRNYWEDLKLAGWVEQFKRGQLSTGAAEKVLSVACSACRDSDAPCPGHAENGRHRAVATILASDHDSRAFAECLEVDG